MTSSGRGEVKGLKSAGFAGWVATSPVASRSLVGELGTVVGQDGSRGSVSLDREDDVEEFTAAAIDRVNSSHGEQPFSQEFAEAPCAQELRLDPAQPQGARR